MAAISDDEDSAVRRFGMTLVALVGLVLVVACTNLGNLMLARGNAAASSPCSAPSAHRGGGSCANSVSGVMLAAGGAFASYVMFELLRVSVDTDQLSPCPFGVEMPRCRFIPR